MHDVNRLRGLTVPSPMTDEEAAHGAQMDADMSNDDDRSRDEVRATNDPATPYERDRSDDDTPAYDPVEATSAPEYTTQPSFEEWMKLPFSMDGRARSPGFEPWALTTYVETTTQFKTFLAGI
ncbi:uncharacterized protein B0I36DRAFT_360039 [Microdochium trichocladiopsis]|uniref:Uncharacterized protein n=1 Tax=Microdochium trichocladiopsis TaxID=1682393 RepID=A0A9P8YAS5_9PEZI|nr:uncharacterized protein B0I36DRAFT_360039 [Microdochium trichocladiopsis]KAH7034525.1 hypothetical protein B0I36DRAFT_360039 [Microdochium trichocladiopsis]